MKTTSIEFHPLADMFPLITDEELKKLADDIKEHGLIEPITMLDGKILDGRNRYNAADMVGVKLGPDDYIEFDPVDNGDPVDFVIAKNIHRRHLTVGQRAALGVEVYKRLGEFVQGDGIQSKPKLAEERRKEAAAKVGVSADSIEQAHKIAKAAPEELKKVKAGKQSLHKAAKKAEKAAAGADLDEAHIRINEVCGKAFAGAVHEEMIDALKHAKAVIEFAKLNDENMQKLMPVLRLGWKLPKAIAYLDKELSPASTFNQGIELFLFGGSKRIEVVMEGVKFTLTKAKE